MHSNSNKSRRAVVVGVEEMSLTIPAQLQAAAPGVSNITSITTTQRAPGNGRCGGHRIVDTQSCSGASTMSGAPEPVWYCCIGMPGLGAPRHYAGPWLSATTGQCLTCGHTMCRACTKGFCPPGAQ